MKNFPVNKSQTDRKEIEGIVADYLKRSAFTDRKLTDTPTDSLEVVNRRYVTLNGAVASRPASSVATVGQTYLATDTSIPMTYTTAGWVNGVGSLVALNS